MNTTKDYEAVSLIYSDEYVLVYRGHRARAIAGQSEEVIIYQWINNNLFTEDCKKREEMYVYASKTSPHIAKLITSDFPSGRYIYESFSCSLAQYSRFLDDHSPVWEQVWHDAVLALWELHSNYLNHGNVTSNSFFFKKDGTLKFVGIFPNFNDDFKYNISEQTTGRSFLEHEFQKDIVALCKIFLNEPYRKFLPQADIDDCGKLAKGEITLAVAKGNAVERFKTVEQTRENKAIDAHNRALEQRATLEQKYRKGPGFLFMTLVCTFIVIAVIGVKYAIDKADSEMTPVTQKSSGKMTNKEWEHELQEGSDKIRHTNEADDEIVHTPATLPGREIPAELTIAPQLSEAPDTLVAVGRVNYIIGTQLNVFIPNKQVTIELVMDNDTKIVYADGTPRRQSEIELKQEVEVEYELGKEDERAYAHVIRLQTDSRKKNE